MDWQAFQKRVLAPRPDELDDLASEVIAYGLAKRMASVLIRRVLSEPIPPKLPPKTHHTKVTAATRNLIFLKEAVPRDADDAALAMRWASAIEVLGDVNTYTWGSKEKRAKLDAIIQTPWKVHAFQAAVVGIQPPDDPGLDFMAVLALDGSDESADALMPHVHHAMTTGEGLEQLERLKKYAADTKPMRAMLANTEKLLSERSAASPILTLLHDIGVEVDTCSLSLWFASRETNETNDHLPKAQVNFSLDSRGAPYMHVSIDGPKGGTTSFNNLMIHKDAFGLGRPELGGLPDLFARAARQLGVTWDWEGAAVYSNLRGRKRATVLRWLRGV